MSLGLAYLLVFIAVVLVALRGLRAVGLTPTTERRVALSAVLFGSVVAALVFPDRPMPLWGWAICGAVFIIFIAKCFVWFPARQAALAAGLFTVVSVLGIASPSIEEYARRTWGILGDLILALMVVGVLCSVSILFRRYAKVTDQ